MSLTTIVLVMGASWSILSISVGFPLGRVMKRADRRVTPEVYRINRLRVLPPVPPPVTPPYSQTQPDASWFDGMPCEILSDEAVRSLFEDIVRGEFA